MTIQTNLPTVTFNGTFLELRNAALQLGGKKSWQIRKVNAAFGEEICRKALELSKEQLEPAKLLLVNYFESKFTYEDRQMEIALKKAENRVYESEDDI